VDRAAETGDHVVIDYLGKLDGEPFPGGEGRDQLIELGSGRLIPGFEEQLVGVKAGDERELNVRFPDDYAEPLAGQAATFDVKVSEVKAKRLPELDDDFASEAAGLDTLQELREDIAERLRHADEHEIEHEFERAVVDAAVAAARIEIPPQLIHARAHEMVEETTSALARQGISKETYLQIAGKSEEEIAHEAEPEAERALRRDAVIAAVVEAEQIEPTDEELLEVIAPSAERAKTKPEKLLEQLRSSGRLQRLREDVAARQAVELMVKEARPISVEQAKARNLIWTPGKDEPGEGAPSGSGQLWTPGS
jgi:trigger factor